MPTTVSESARLREKGNKFYRKATDDLAPAIQQDRLQKALDSYDKALTKATDNTDRSSAYKNLAMTNWKMAKVRRKQRGEADDITRHYKHALCHFQRAKEYGKGRELAWLDSLVASGINCWEDLQGTISRLQYKQRVRVTQGLVAYLVDDVTMTKEYLDLAKVYFHWSVTALEGRKYQESLNLLAECSFPLNEAYRLMPDEPSHLSACDALQNDIFMQTCIAESVQARVRGEELLVRVTKNEEDLNIDMVWEVVDWFRRAAMLTRERDLELEAMALSSLGRVYDKVLMLKERAKACFKKVLELADAMIPRAVWDCDWYLSARQALESYQRQNLLKEQEEEQKKREETLKLVKDDLDVIEKKFVDCSKLQFIKFLYEKYPPKNPSHKLGDVPKEPEPEDLKKLYRAAAIHYHPDKVKEEEHGMKWKVLSEEITKLITKQYEHYKGF